MQHLGQGGFEPEAVESLQDSELDVLYRELESHLAQAPAPQAQWLREEMALHHESGKAAASYAFAVARRREPGEKPPASRDRG